MILQAKEELLHGVIESYISRRIFLISSKFIMKGLNVRKVIIDQLVPILFYK